MSKIYIAGKITGLKNFKELSKEAEDYLLSQGHLVMNPSVLPAGFEHDEYMKICYSMIDVCDQIFMLSNWKESKGAKLEHEYATASTKNILYQEV